MNEIKLTPPCSFSQKNLCYDDFTLTTKNAHGGLMNA